LRTFTKTPKYPQFRPPRTILNPNANRHSQWGDL
jgi:hypothetical protein